MNFKIQMFSTPILVIALLNVVCSYAAEFGTPQNEPRLPGLPPDIVQLLFGAPKVELPTRSVLTNRLKNLGIQEDFIKQSGILDRLAGLTKYPYEVVFNVQESINTYVRISGVPIMGKIFGSFKDDIVRAILADHPEAIQTLEQQGSLKKKESK